MVTGPVPVVRCLSLSDREYRRSIRHCSGESVSSRAGGLWLDQSATGPSRTLWRWRRREGLFIGVGPGCGRVVSKSRRVGVGGVTTTMRVGRVVSKSRPNDEFAKSSSLQIRGIPPFSKWSDSTLPPFGRDFDKVPPKERQCLVGRVGHGEDLGRLTPARVVLGQIDPCASRVGPD